MILTVSEFCSFNLKSRIQLLKKDGILIKVRRVMDKYIIRIYLLYRFLVEVIIRENEIVAVNPVINKDIVEL